jgi:hypothetical protein
MSEAYDNYQLDTVKRKRAQLQAELDVIAAQAALAKYLRAEADEIDSFLAAIEAAQVDG